MKQKYRRDPKPGTVLRIPLPNGVFAYMCSIGAPSTWLYSFLTDAPVRNPKYFSTAKWMRPCLVLRFLSAFDEVIRLDLTEKDVAQIPLWKPAPPSMAEKARFSPVYCVYDPVQGTHRPGTAEEIAGMHREVWLGGDEIVPWVQEQVSEMTLINVPAVDKDDRKEAERSEAPDVEEEDRLIEIVFPPNQPELVARLEEMEAHFQTELEMADCGCLNGSGVMEGGGSIDVALDVHPRRVKTALRAIRKVLRKFKAPPGTQILEHHPDYDDPIVHPLSEK